MAQTISAADANRRFSELLRTVRAGKTVVVTSHGKPVAQLIPFEDADAAAIGRVFERVEKIRAQLARQGVTLAGALAQGETVRELAHAGHRY